MNTKLIKLITACAVIVVANLTAQPARADAEAKTPAELRMRLSGNTQQHEKLSQGAAALGEACKDNEASEACEAATRREIRAAQERLKLSAKIRADNQALLDMALHARANSGTGDTPNIVRPGEKKLDAREAMQEWAIIGTAATDPELAAKYADAWERPEAQEALSQLRKLKALRAARGAGSPSDLTPDEYIQNAVLFEIKEEFDRDYLELLKAGRAMTAFSLEMQAQCYEHSLTPDTCRDMSTTDVKITIPKSMGATVDAATALFSDPTPEKQVTATQTGPRRKLR